MQSLRELKKSSALVLAASSLVSQLLGFLRDKFLSYIYGAGFILDSYYAAFRVPEFMYLSIGSFVSSSILVPLFAKKFQEDNVKIWFQKLITTFAAFFIVVYGLVLIFLPLIVRKLYSHADLKFQSAIIFYGSVLIFSTFFLSVSSIISSVAQEKRDFLRVGLAPICYNLGTIIGIVLLRPMWGILGVCIGVVLGSLMHMLVQLPTAIRLGLFEGYYANLYRLISVKLLSKTLGQSFWRTISLMGSAVVFFLMTYFASLYPEGSITVVTLAFTIQTAFHTLTGVSYATAVLPVLADRFVNQEYHLFDKILQRGLKKMFLFSFVITGMVYIFQYEVIYILFGGGNFTQEDVILTGVSLAVFVLSLYAQNAILMFSRASYARGDYAIPLFTNLSSAILVFILGKLAFNSSNSYIHTVWAVPVVYSLSQYLALIVASILYKKNKYIQESYLPFSYVAKIILAIILVSVTSKYMLGSVLNGYDSMVGHIIISILIFIFYSLSVYSLLGLINDEQVKEDRYYIKSKVKRFLLALFPKRS